MHHNTCCIIITVSAIFIDIFSIYHDTCNIMITVPAIFIDVFSMHHNACPVIIAVPPIFIGIFPMYHNARNVIIAVPPIFIGIFSMHHRPGIIIKPIPVLINIAFTMMHLTGYFIIINPFSCFSVFIAFAYVIFCSFNIFSIRQVCKSFYHLSCYNIKIIPAAVAVILPFNHQTIFIVTHPFARYF